MFLHSKSENAYWALYINLLPTLLGIIMANQIYWHLLVFVINLLLFIFSRKAVFYLQQKEDASKVFIFRSMNVLFFLLHGSAIISNNYGVDLTHPLILQVGKSIVGLYLLVVVFSIFAFYFERKFGIVKKIEGKIVHVDSYQSRLLEIILLAGFILLGVFYLVQVWNLTSTLETTGFLGIVLGFLALTNGIWAPDLYFGLVILSSDMINSGDVIELGSEDDEYIVHRVNFIYTVLLNIRNNHRSIVRNSHLMNQRVDNLSKRAHIDGLRECLVYKVGYPEGNNPQEIQSNFYDFKERLHKMFEDAFNQVKGLDSRLNDKLDHEILLTNTGDFALEYSVYFYLQDLKTSKSTKQARLHLIKTKFLINEKILENSLVNGIDLSTPVLIDNV